VVLRDDRLATSSGILMVGVGSLGAIREAQLVTRLLVVCRSYPDMLTDVSNNGEWWGNVLKGCWWSVVGIVLPLILLRDRVRIWSGLRVRDADHCDLIFLIFGVSSCLP
jgi:hypothetical protein